VKSRFFRSGRNTPNDSMMKDDEYEIFDIEDFLKGKSMKKKKIKSTTSADFNPFDQGRTKLDKKKAKEEIDNFNRKYITEKHDQSKIKIQEGQNYVKNKDYSIEYNHSDGSYKKDFHEDEIPENGGASASHKVLNNNQNSKNESRENADEYDEKIKFYQKMMTDCQGEENKDNRMTQPAHCQKCSMCESASFINSQIRLKKKENPALMEPSIIKYLLFI
jgi:hypothetical protein